MAAWEQLPCRLLTIVQIVYETCAVNQLCKILSCVASNSGLYAQWYKKSFPYPTQPRNLIGPTDLYILAQACISSTSTLNKVMHLAVLRNARKGQRPRISVQEPYWLEDEMPALVLSSSILIRLTCTAEHLCKWKPKQHRSSAQPSYLIIVALSVTVDLPGCSNLGGLREAHEQ